MAPIKMQGALKPVVGLGSDSSVEASTSPFIPSSIICTFCGSRSTPPHQRCDDTLYIARQVLGAPGSLIRAHNRCCLDFAAPVENLTTSVVIFGSSDARSDIEIGVAS
jgi:hypothetical protein